MATTPVALLTIEQYLSTIYRPDCDFVDGVLEERNAGELDHGTLQVELAYWFRSHRDEWRVKVVADYGTRVSKTRVRIPDICVISLDAEREPVRLTPQLLCIEILSPEDRPSRTALVMEDFLQMGVQHLWIIDPEERVAYPYSAAGRSKVSGTRLEIPGSPIYLDLPTLFASLDV